MKITQEFIKYLTDACLYHRNEYDLTGEHYIDNSDVYPAESSRILLARELHALLLKAN